ncbi:hypothetical protein MTR67_012770 [Solanum verrucosum]|uniref:Reverse transcriptase zinc-binding domain-containing protein n=1 Tax=Solanum verrucosum TaxID=315347 RepID=A0AAF0QBX3_SOLVR|nr:hypothetical protein MTR67_012770 [Solanum verrucosum]
MLEVSSSKPLASESKGFAFWVKLIAPDLPSADYLSYVVCELLHMSRNFTPGKSSFSPIPNFPFNRTSVAKFSHSAAAAAVPPLLPRLFSTGALRSPYPASSSSLPKKFGGLGIKNLDTHSKTLGMKWLWKYANDKETLWGRVIEAKYEEEDRWMTKEITTPYGVNLWRSIRDLWNELKCFFKIKSTMAELWTTEGWRFNFRRQFNDWEIPRMADFINKIEQFSGLGIDELWWKGDEKGTYEVSKAYMKMNHNQQPSSWPLKNIWKTKIPYIVACFVWLLAKEAVAYPREPNEKRDNFKPQVLLV